MHCHNWSADEIDYLKKHYKTTKVAVLVRRLGRKATTIVRKASKLRLVKVGPPEPSWLPHAVQLRLRGWSWKDIAALYQVKPDNMRFYVLRRHPEVKKPRRDDVAPAQVTRLLQAGLHSAEVARQLDISKKKVSYWRKKLFGQKLTPAEAGQRSAVARKANKSRKETCHA